MGSLIDRFGPKKVIGFSLVFLAAANLALPLANKLWHIYVLYGLAAVGHGGTALVSHAVVAARWFQRRRALAIAVTNAGVSMGQMVMAPLCLLLITALGWRAAWFVLGLLFIFPVLPLILLVLRGGPEEMGMGPDGVPLTAANPDPNSGPGATPSPGQTGAAPTASPPVAAVGKRAPAFLSAPVRNALRTSDFWKLFFGFFTCGFTALMVGTHLAVFAMDRGISETSASLALGLIGGLNIAGLLAAGLISDRIGRRRPLGAIYFLRGMSFLILLSTQSEAVLYLSAALFGFAQIATVPLTSSLVADLWGRVSMGTLFGMISFAHQAGAAVGTWLAGFIFDTAGTYAPAFILSMVLLTLSSAASLAIKERWVTPVRMVKMAAEGSAGRS